jgi:hypothetical protein
VVHTVKDILEGHRTELAAAMHVAGLPGQFGHILPYFSHNVDAKMYPCLMIDQRSERTEWIAMPDIAADMANLTIWGMVHWDEPEQSAEAIGVLGTVVKLILNRRHRAFPIDETHDLYFEDATPVSSVEYGVAEMNSAVVKAFQASFSSRVCVQLRSES